MGSTSKPQDYTILLLALASHLHGWTSKASHRTIPSCGLLGRFISTDSTTSKPQDYTILWLAWAVHHHGWTLKVSHWIVLSCGLLGRSISIDGHQKQAAGLYYIDACLGGSFSWIGTRSQPQDYAIVRLARSVYLHGWARYSAFWMKVWWLITD